MIPANIRDAILFAAGAMTFRMADASDGERVMVAEPDPRRGDVNLSTPAVMALREVHKASAAASPSPTEARAQAARGALEQALRQARGDPADPSTTMLVRNYRRALADRLIEITETDAGEFIEYCGGIDD